MFAVLKTGGKQYKVKSGDLLHIEKIIADEGETVQFNDVLIIGGEKSFVGNPLLDGAAVQAVVVDQVKGKKTVNFVKRRRKHGSQRTKGHRQKLTLVRITDIVSKGGDKTGVKLATGHISEKKKSTKKTNASTKRSEIVQSAPADDLTRLSGVGPAMLKKLNAAGITSFTQIAAWTSDNISKVDESLSLKGRIEREGWVEQSKSLIDKN